jgi:hypothetical protein
LKTVEIPDLTKSEKREFDSFIDKKIHPLGCWTWTGAQNGKFYGQFYLRNKFYQAHRIAWEIANDAKIPSGMLIMHLCDNPPCVNPDHLTVGTSSDNIEDSRRKRRRRRMPKQSLTSPKKYVTI